MEAPRGLIEIYTGEGKGKTTAALGLALRASGQGLKVIMVQFVKGSADCGEHKFVARHHPFDIVQLSSLDPFKAAKDDLRKAAVETLDFARKTLAEGKYDVVILDEVFVALSLGLIAEKDVLELMDAKPPRVELVMTGRKAPMEVVKRADLVSEILAIKHPYEQGIPARKGIEY